MRSIGELGALRADLHHALSWPMLLSLAAEANDVGGAPFTRSVFALAWLTDISPWRVEALLAELADVGAITYEHIGDARTFRLEVL